MTLNDLALELIRAHGENAGDSNYVTTVEQWIKDALDEMALLTNWRAFVTNTTLATVASQQLYTLPTLVRDVRFLREPDTKQPIYYATKQEIAAMGLDFTVEGRPTYWFYNDQKDVSHDFRYEIGFQPIPDAIYTLDVAYNIIPADLATGDHIPIQKEMMIALKNCARSYMSLDDKDFDSADRFYGKFQTICEMLRRRENAKFDDWQRMQPRDIGGKGSDRRFARLDPDHFS